MKQNIEEVIEKYGDMVYRIALTHTGCKENAEDIFQDVFIRYSEKLLKFKNDEHEKAWLIRVTINKCKNLLASSWNKKNVELNENISFETHEEFDVINAINKLPKNYRTVIYLFYYEGYKIKEIAEILKINESTIKTWAFRARELLKESLEGGF
ncbi:MAG: sigma-70 family RNA polymerase sigma factor [Clostridia bacterium]|nr:sigma-70 family RNA polymerase sigma factor [Clostridia bacterium]